MLGFPQMGDFSVIQTFHIPLSSFLRMLMIDRVTDGPFRAAFLLLSALSFTLPAPLEILSPICTFHAMVIQTVFWIFLRLTKVHHSPGLHSKTNVKLNQLKRIIHRKWPGAPLDLRILTDADTTTSSTYRLDRHQSMTKMENSSAA